MKLLVSLHRLQGEMTVFQTLRFTIPQLSTLLSNDQFPLQRFSLISIFIIRKKCKKVNIDFQKENVTQKTNPFIKSGSNTSLHNHEEDRNIRFLFLPDSGAGSDAD